MEYIGTMVTFRIPCIVNGAAGTTKVGGRVIAVLGDGRLGVRLQQGGYYQVKESEVTPFTDDEWRA